MEIHASLTTYLITPAVILSVPYDFHPIDLFHSTSDRNHSSSSTSYHPSLVWLPEPGDTKLCHTSSSSYLDCDL